MRDITSANLLAHRFDFATIIILVMASTYLFCSMGTGNYYFLAETTAYLGRLYVHLFLREDSEDVSSLQHRARARTDMLRTLDAKGKDELEKWMRQSFTRAPHPSIGFVTSFKRPFEDLGLVPSRAELNPVEMKEIKRGNVEEWLAGEYIVPNRSFIR